MFSSSPTERRPYQRITKQRSKIENTSFQQRQNKHLIDFLVNEIGIEERIAAILIYVHECSTKNETLELLTRNDNGFYRHVFIPVRTTKSSELCELCEEVEDEHEVIDLGIVDKALAEEEFFYLSKRFSYEKDKEAIKQAQQHLEEIMDSSLENDSINESNFYSFHLDGESKIITCEICFIDYDKPDIAHFGNGEAPHNICLQCMDGCIKEKVNNMAVENILCPHCGVPLTPDVIQKFTDKLTFAKYQKFIKNIEIQKNPNMIWCPNSKCSVVISIAKKSKTINCPKCSISICCKCKREDHPFKSCDSAFKSEIKTWENSSEIQKCKKCRSIVEKISGCNHMSCSVCGYEWCWLCGSTFSYAHFSPINPFGCPGMQDRIETGKCKIYLWKLLIFVGIITLTPIALPIAMLLAGPFVIGRWTEDKLYHEPNRFKKFSLIFLGVLLGLIVNPFVWIGLLIYFIPRLVDNIMDYFRNRNYITERSENRLHERLINDAISQMDNEIENNNSNNNNINNINNNMIVDDDNIENHVEIILKEQILD